jgi:glyoxylase-like metal-dependent hydrolase (beta-lactamase superfamily II)
MQVGDFEIAHVRTGSYRWDGGSFFGVVPKTLWGRRAPTDELNRIAVAFNSYLIRNGDHTLLIETGVGDKLDERARERMAMPPDPADLREIIAAHGVDPESIDIVVNSHLHFDHVGGNTILTDAGPLPAFPRATYYASRAEWEFAHRRHPRDSVSYNDSNYDPLVAEGRMTLVEPGHEVVPGVRMQLAPGHNPNMCVVTVASGGRTFCFWADLVPTANHAQPTWVAAFDLDPIETIDQKTRWLGRAADEGWICGFGHDPEIGFARIERDARRGFRTAAL